MLSTACKCNRIGSVGEDCDKMTGKYKCKKIKVECCNLCVCLPFTGKCRCRPGVKGPQCDQCPAHWHLAGHGCVPGPSQSCQRLKCQYGAMCHQMGSRVECSCQLNCSVHNQSASTPVWLVVCLRTSTQSNLLCLLFLVVPLMEHSICRIVIFVSTCVGYKREFT